MAEKFQWTRYWCNREDTYVLNDHGFLSDPATQWGRLTNPSLRTFESLDEIPALALLGEPGIGKSWTIADEITHLKERSPGVEVVHVDLRAYGSEDRLSRAIFDSPVFTRWRSSTAELHLYLDSLDECTLRVNNVAALIIDSLTQEPLERLKVRIGCRTASWPPFLENALKKAFGANRFAAVELVPLLRQDVVHAAQLSGINSPEKFLERIELLGIAAFAGKPLTLQMLIGTVIKGGELPNNVLDLYAKGCQILCEEQNDSRRAAGLAGELSLQQRLAIASRVAAITEFGNKYAIWTGKESADIPQEDVALAQLVGGYEGTLDSVEVKDKAVAEAMTTGLFSSRGQERLGWAHKTFAEYLAAKYCLNHHLSLAQILSLIFHPARRRVVPQLREVASWLAVQNEAVFAEIAANDPEILLGSGSPNLTSRQREAVVESLLRVCDAGTFLHAKNLLLQHLFHPGLSNQLEPVISNTNRKAESRLLALDVIRACDIRDLGACLIRVALSAQENAQVRILAIHVLSKVANDRERQQLRPLLRTTMEEDPRDELRGSALHAVYSRDSYDDGIWDFLETPRDAHLFGSYRSFLAYEMAFKLNADNLSRALRWAAGQTFHKIGALADLQQKIFLAASENLANPEIAALFADVVLAGCKIHQGFPSPYGGEEGLGELFLKDEQKRHQLLAALLPLLTKETAYFVHYPLQILSPADFSWYASRIEESRSHDPSVEADLISRLSLRSAIASIGGESDRQQCLSSPSRTEGRIFF